MLINYLDEEEEMDVGEQESEQEMDYGASEMEAGIEACETLRGNIRGMFREYDWIGMERMMMMDWRM